MDDRAIIIVCVILKESLYYARRTQVLLLYNIYKTFGTDEKVCLAEFQLRFWRNVLCKKNQLGIILLNKIIIQKTSKLKSFKFSLTVCVWNCCWVLSALIVITQKLWPFLMLSWKWRNSAMVAKSDMFRCNC